MVYIKGINCTSIKGGQTLRLTTDSPGCSVTYVTNFVSSIPFFFLSDFTPNLLNSTSRPPKFYLHFTAQTNTPFFLYPKSVVLPHCFLTIIADLPHSTLILYPRSALPLTPHSYLNFKVSSLQLFVFSAILAQGDTCASIAKLFKLRSLSGINSPNPFLDCSKIVPGQQVFTLSFFSISICSLPKGLANCLIAHTHSVVLRFVFPKEYLLPLSLVLFPTW